LDTRSPILSFPNVKSLTFFVLLVAKAGSLPLLRMLSFVPIRYFISSHGSMSVLAHIMCCALTLHPMMSCVLCLVQWSVTYLSPKCVTSESQQRYAKVTVSTLVLCYLVYVILAVITFLEQGSDNRKASVVFLMKMQELGVRLSPAENFVPLLLHKPLIFFPIDPGFLNKCYIDFPCGKFLTKECLCSLLW